MKKHFVKLSYIFLISLMFPLIHSAQTTAVNFNVNDCDGINHDLYSTLDAGKVVVLVWVMPCAGCIPGAVDAYNAAQSFSVSHPGKVLYYLVDDYANSTCSYVRGWGNTNGIVNSTVFSDAAISMSDYGVDGMPKVVVLGGADHTIFYNENNADITQSGVENAINSALIVAGLNESKDNKILSVFPNPVEDFLTIVTDQKALNQEYTFYDLTGKKVKSFTSGIDLDGKIHSQCYVGDLTNGSYILSYKQGNTMQFFKIIVSH